MAKKKEAKQAPVKEEKVFNRSAIIRAGDAIIAVIISGEKISGTVTTEDGRTLSYAAELKEV